MKDLFAMKWVKVIKIVNAQAKLFESILTISIIVNTQIDKKMIKTYKKNMLKRAHNDLFFDSQNIESDVIFKSTQKRKMRFDKLSNQIIVRKDVVEKVSKYNLRLLNYWFCVDERCFNDNNRYDKIWCWIDRVDEHYNMNQTQQFKWIEVMQQENLDVILKNFFKSLYKKWTRIQESINSLFKKFIQQQRRNEFKNEIIEIKSVMQQLKKMIEKNMKYDMKQKMINNMNKMNKRINKQRSRFSFLSFSLVRRRSFTRRRRRRFSFSFSSNFATMTKATKRVFSTLQVSINVASIATSSFSFSSLQCFFSSIDLSKQKHDIVTIFFAWKIKKVLREKIKAKLTIVHEICEDQLFKTTRLKTMFDITHSLYQRVINLNISNNMTLDFAQNLRLFKQKWRSI